MADAKKCVFCGKPALWDNFGGICGDCYSQEERLAEIKRNNYKQFADELIEYIDTHRINERIIKNKIYEILNEVNEPNQ